MIVLLIFVALTIVGLILSRRDDDWEFFGGLLGLLSGVVVLFMIVVIFVDRHTIFIGIAKHESLRKTVEMARKRTDNVERYTFLKEIADSNAGVAAEQADNKTQWDLWVPDEIENVKPIE